MKGRITEIFRSVQGEGIYLGEEQVFVRLFGCNLSCTFCDTHLNRFMEYEPHELLEEIKLYDGDLHSVSFTGGEPLLQYEFLRETLELMKQNGYSTYLETNGTLIGELRKVIDFVDIVAMDLKLPSSSGMGYFWGIHRRFLQVASRKEVFLKTIIAESTKKEDVVEALKLIKEINPAAVLVLQPNSFDAQDKLKDKMNIFKDLSYKEGITCCVIPQIHKTIGFP